MALYQQGITLKALLEDPNLLNPPKPNQENKEKENKEKEKKVDGVYTGFSGQSAYLGGNLWDDVEGQDGDFKLEYMDLDEFLIENGVPQVNPDDFLDLTNGGSLNKKSPVPQEKVTVEPAQPVLSPTVPESLHIDVTSPLADALRIDPEISPSISSPLSSPPISPPMRTMPFGGRSPTPPKSPEVSFEINEADIALATIPGESEFDPRRREFSGEELRPQPMIKKSKKTFVPEELKDDKYWSRRRKNNVAAKRSRDARRIKENQISLRANFLETENKTFRDEVAKLKKENYELKKRLMKYEPVS